MVRPLESYDPLIVWTVQTRLRQLTTTVAGGQYLARRVRAAMRWDESHKLYAWLEARGENYRHDDNDAPSRRDRDRPLR